MRAWIVQRQSGPAHVDAHAVAWTDRQVHVRYLDPHGREGIRLAVGQRGHAALEIAA